MIRNILSVFLLLISLSAISQTYTKFKTDYFEIKFPKKWIFKSNGMPPGIAFYAYRKPEGITDKAKVSINVNIIDNANADLDKSFSRLMKAISNVENFKLIDSGIKTIKGQKIKWLIETHLNSIDNKQQMHNYVFIAYKNDKTFILTMAAFSELYEEYKPIFDIISKSFILY